MDKEQFLQLARNNSWVGVDFILRYQNPNYLGISEFQKEIHRTIDKVKESISLAKQGTIPWEEVKNTALIHIPRGHGKTSHLLGRILWELGKNPNHKIKIVCETDNNARKRIIFIQHHILENKHLHLLFPHLKPAESGLWNNLQLYVERNIITVDPSVEGSGILSSSTGGRASILFCLTPEAQVCTRKGWVSGASLEENTEILVYDPNTKEVFFEKPKNIIKFEKKKKAVYFEELDLLCTEDHKFLCIIDDEQKILTAKEIYEVIKSGKEVKIPVGGYKKTKEFPKTISLFINKGSVIKLLSDEFAFLQSLLYFHSYSLKNNIYFRPTYAYESLKIFQWLRNLFPIKKYSLSDNEIIIDSKNLNTFVLDFIQSKNKFLQTENLIYGDFKDAASFLAGLDYAGNFEKFNKCLISHGYRKISFKTKKYEHLLKYNPIFIKRSSRTFNEIIDLLAYCAAITNTCVIRHGDVCLELNKDEYITLKKLPKLRRKKSIWWCVTTSTGFFICKTPKTVFVTGNCDDPIGMHNALIYPENARKAEEAFNSNWLPMLEDDGYVIIAYTVWTENDFPYKMETNCSSCLVYKNLVDEDLTPVWPEKFPQGKLKQIKEKIGSTAFARGYQGKPSSDKDTIFKKEAILNSISTDLYLGQPLNKENVVTFVGVDLAISSKKSAKNTAIVVVQVDTQTGKKHLVDIIVDQFTSIETAQKIIEVATKYKPNAIYVENNAYQQALLEWVDVIDKNRVTAGLIEGYYTGAQKFNPFTGLPALAAEFEFGSWVIHKTDHEYDKNCNCPFCLCITEFLSFPFGKTSDIVMATFFAREAYKDHIGEDSICDIKFIKLDNQ